MCHDPPALRSEDNTTVKNFTVMLFEIRRSIYNFLKTFQEKTVVALGRGFRGLYGNPIK